VLSLPRRTEQLLLLGSIVLGVALRFSFLDHKVYWYDEAVSSLEVSGYRPGEVAADIQTGRLVSHAEVDQYQGVQPGSPKSAFDTIAGLVANEPQLTPAYFVLLRWWSQLLGHSVAADRALSALLSVLALAGAFWLCRELFPAAPRVAWLSTALLAVSPYQLLYAQEARPYSMWLAVTLLSGALLVRASRRPSLLAWALYAGSAALALYTYLLSLLVLAGQALFVAIESRWRVTRQMKAFAACAASALLAFAAWPYRGQRSGAGNDHYPLLQYLSKWLRSVGILFADFNLRPDSPKAQLIPYAVLLLALLTLCGYALYFLWRHASREQSAFLLTLIASLCVPLALLDALSGSSLAVVTRYSLPSLVGLQLAVSYLLATRSAAGDARRAGGAWQLCAAALLALGGLSCLGVVRAATWWNKDPDNYIQAASRIINAAPDPVVVVSDVWLVRILSLEHQLRPQIHYRLTVQPALPAIDAPDATVFVVLPSEHLRSALQSSFVLEPLGPELWKVTTPTAPRSEAGPQGLPGESYHAGAAVAPK
jgi:uncharacterized membrane protein